MIHLALERGHECRRRTIAGIDGEAEFVEDGILGFQYGQQLLPIDEERVTGAG